MSATATMSGGRDRRPILVSGMPRSGTTWLGRLLATAPGTALLGREPMNPHEGQYRMGGSVSGWAALDSLSSAQQRALRLAFRGLNPMVLGRYGRRQWAAPMPWTRVVVKDPFAMLSLPTVTRVTGAVAVLLYRHPGAVLASYRRMNWQPDLDELRPLLAAHRGVYGATGPELPRPGDASFAEAMGSFWAGLYEMALDRVGGGPAPVVVSHEELAGGGVPAAKRLFQHLSLRYGEGTEEELRRENALAPGAADSRLHNLDRAPSTVAGLWRSTVDAADVELIEQVTHTVLARVQSARLPLP